MSNNLDYPEWLNASLIPRIQSLFKSLFKPEIDLELRFGIAYGDLIPQIRICKDSYFLESSLEFYPKRSKNKRKITFEINTGHTAFRLDSRNSCKSRLKQTIRTGIRDSRYEIEEYAVIRYIGQLNKLFKKLVRKSMFAPFTFS